MGISKLPISTTNNPSIYSKVIAEGTISSSPNTKTISIPAGSYIGYSSTSNPVVFNGGAITNTFLGSADGVKSTTTSSISTLNTYILPGANIKGIPYNMGLTVNNISIASNNQYVVAVISTDGGIYFTSSTNYGESWSGPSILSGYANSGLRAVVVYDPVFAKFVFYAQIPSFGYTVLFYSDNSTGTSWNTSSSIALGTTTAAATNGSGIYVGACGSTTGVITTNGTSITTATFPVAFTKMFSANGVFFASTSTGLNVYTSTNGTTWTLRTLPNTSDNFTGVVYSQGTYIIYTNGGYYFTSTDLSTWTIAKDGYIVGQNKPSTNRTTAQGPFCILPVNGALFSVLGQSQAGYNTITNTVSTSKIANIESVATSTTAFTGLRSGVSIELINQPQFTVFPNSYTEYLPGTYDSVSNIIYLATKPSTNYYCIIKISADTSTGAAIYGTSTTAF